MSFLSRIFRQPVYMILLLAFLQVWSATYFLQIEGFHAVNSLLFLITGVGISFCLLRVPSSNTGKPAIFNRQLPFKLLIVALLLPISYQLCRPIIDGTPLQKEYADMLPVIKTMGQRFLQGEWGRVYAPIPEIWDGIQPIYLPAMWLPFVPSLLLDFDLRWVTVGGIWLCVLMAVSTGVWKRKLSHLAFCISIIILLAWLHLDGTNNVIRLSEEGVVFFYYSLMVIAIISGNAWFMGVAAALCLLSRYTIIGWIPFAVLYLLFTKQYLFLWKASAAGIVSLLILIIPFGLQPLLLHLQLPSLYMTQAERVWNENPEFFTHSLGMAKFFGPGNILLLHTILVIGVFLLPLAFLLFIKKKSLPREITLLSGFQLSITFFYNFLDVSYLYLYYTPVFVSLVITGWLVLNKQKHQVINTGSSSSKME